MDIEYMKRFIAVGQCLNFSKAADMLFISQPTLSHSITNLEKKLGTPLLVRNTKYVKLTAAGERFLTAAIEIVGLYENAVNDISQRLDLGNDVLNVGYIGPATDNMFSSWVKQFRKAYPDVKVHVLRYATSAISEAFENRLIHLCVLYKMNATLVPGLKYQEVGREKFKVCLSADHPLANQERISLEQLKDEPFVICERATSPSYYDRVLDICARRGFEPQISQKATLITNIYALVSSGLGVAIMSYSEARSYDAYHVKFVDIDDGEDLINSVVVAWVDNLSPLARKFKEIARKGAP